MQKIVPETALLVPDGAQPAFSGELFTVYQWPQTMFDGSTKTFEMLKRADTLQIVAIKDGQLVLVDDEQPGRKSRRHFPGGRLDETDESWLAAAQRELREETGMSFRSWRLIDVRQPVPKIEWFVPWFLATDFEAETTQQLDADGEKISVVMQPFDEVRAAVLSGREPTMNYALELFTRCDSLNTLLGLPEFSGQIIER